jgi:hypothetical protein
MPKALIETLAAGSGIVVRYARARIHFGQFHAMAYHNPYLHGN